MKHLGLICGILWLVLNLLVFADRGVERIQYDAGISEMETLGERRAKCWNNAPGMPAQVRDFEGAMDRILERTPPPRALLVVSASTVFPSIARHQLFPVGVKQIKGKAKEEAEKIGADLAIRIGRSLPWKIFDPRVE